MHFDKYYKDLELDAFALALMYKFSRSFDVEGVHVVSVSGMGEMDSGLFISMINSVLFGSFGLDVCKQMSKWA